MLFCISFIVLCAFVIFENSAAFEINAYTTAVACDGSCTFTGIVQEVTAKNDTVFYSLSRLVPVDGVFFVGTKKPTFVVGDCVSVRGEAQTFRGKQSIVIETIRACSNATEATVKS